MTTTGPLVAQVSNPIGPLLAMAIGDSYGAGFEFAPAAFIKKHNTMLDYVKHPKFERPANAYTDDTQMAMGLVEFILKLGAFAHLDLAEQWVQVFQRDPRRGYSSGFYDILQHATTGTKLLRAVVPQSTKNGGAMRAFPLGVVANTSTVRDIAMMQASVTHATWRGMTAAAAAALMFHHRYHQLGPKADLLPYLTQWLPGVDWAAKPVTPPSTDGIETVQCAIWALLKGTSLADVIQIAVALGGDTDTVAAIAAPAAAVCSETRNALPQAFIVGLENGTYGRDYIRRLDAELLRGFPPKHLATLPPLVPAPKKVKAARPTSPMATGPLDFLFDD